MYINWNEIAKIHLNKQRFYVVNEIACKCGLFQRNLTPKAIPSSQLTNEYQMDPQKYTCWSYNIQPTNQHSVVLTAPLFQRFQQPCQRYISVPCVQHTFSSIDGTTETWTKRSRTQRILFLCYPAIIKEIFHLHYHQKVEEA